MYVYFPYDLALIWYTYQHSFLLRYKQELVLILKDIFRFQVQEFCAIHMT